MPEINDFSHVFEVGMRPRIWDDSETNQSSFWSQKSEPQIVNKIATIFTCQKQFRSHLTAGSLPTFTNVGKFSGSQTLGCIDILLQIIMRKALVIAGAAVTSCSSGALARPSGASYRKSRS